ncbi:MAG: hypothetical protein LC646_06360, partial [Xanthomonadaceae bacterium]|nr:hypothetical protein [Xanthomonadaceae bacterium]
LPVHSMARMESYCMGVIRLVVGTMEVRRKTDDSQPWPKNRILAYRGRKANPATLEVRGRESRANISVILTRMFYTIAGDAAYQTLLRHPTNSKTKN